MTFANEANVNDIGTSSSMFENERDYHDGREISDAFIYIYTPFVNRTLLTRV